MTSREGRLEVLIGTSIEYPVVAGPTQSRGHSGVLPKLVVLGKGLCVD
jgi:hypothetical protein